MDPLEVNEAVRSICDIPANSCSDNSSVFVENVDPVVDYNSNNIISNDENTQLAQVQHEMSSFTPRSPSDVPSNVRVSPIFEQFKVPKSIPVQSQQVQARDWKKLYCYRYKAQNREHSSTPGSFETVKSLLNASFKPITSCQTLTLTTSSGIVTGVSQELSTHMITSSIGSPPNTIQSSLSSVLTTVESCGKNVNESVQAKLDTCDRNKYQTERSTTPVVPNTSRVTETQPIPGDPQNSPLQTTQAPNYAASKSSVTALDILSTIAFNEHERISRTENYPNQANDETLRQTSPHTQPGTPSNIRAPTPIAEQGKETEEMFRPSMNSESPQLKRQQYEHQAQLNQVNVPATISLNQTVMQGHYMPAPPQMPVHVNSVPQQKVVPLPSFPVPFHPGNAAHFIQQNIQQMPPYQNFPPVPHLIARYPNMPSIPSSTVQSSYKNHPTNATASLNASTGPGPQQKLLRFPDGRVMTVMDHLDPKLQNDSTRRLDQLDPKLQNVSAHPRGRAHCPVHSPALNRGVPVEPKDAQSDKGGSATSATSASPSLASESVSPSAQSEHFRPQTRPEEQELSVVSENKQGEKQIFVTSRKRPYNVDIECLLCRVSVRYSLAWKKHVRETHWEIVEKFVCKECIMHFKSKDEFVYHVNKFHPKMLPYNLLPDKHLQPLVEQLRYFRQRNYDTQVNDDDGHVTLTERSESRCEQPQKPVRKRRRNVSKISSEKDQLGSPVGLGKTYVTSTCAQQLSTWTPPVQTYNSNIKTNLNNIEIKNKPEYKYDSNVQQMLKTPEPSQNEETKFIPGLPGTVPGIPVTKPVKLPGIQTICSRLPDNFMLKQSVPERTGLNPISELQDKNKNSDVPMVTNSFIPGCGKNLRIATSGDNAINCIQKGRYDLAMASNIPSVQPKVLETKSPSINTATLDNGRSDNMPQSNIPTSSSDCPRTRTRIDPSSAKNRQVSSNGNLDAQSVHSEHVKQKLSKKIKSHKQQSRSNMRQVLSPEIPKTVTNLSSSAPSSYAVEQQRTNQTYLQRAPVPQTVLEMGRCIAIENEVSKINHTIRPAHLQLHPNVSNSPVFRGNLRHRNGTPTYPEISREARNKTSTTLTSANSSQVSKSCGSRPIVANHMSELLSVLPRPILSTCQQPSIVRPRMPNVNQINPFPSSTTAASSSTSETCTLSKPTSQNPSPHPNLVKGPTLNTHTETADFDKLKTSGVAGDTQHQEKIPSDSSESSQKLNKPYHTVLCEKSGHITVDYVLPEDSNDVPWVSESVEIKTEIYAKAHENDDASTKSYVNSPDRLLEADMTLEEIEQSCKALEENNMEVFNVTYLVESSKPSTVKEVTGSSSESLTKKQKLSKEHEDMIDETIEAVIMNTGEQLDEFPLEVSSYIEVGDSKTKLKIRPRLVDMNLTKPKKKKVPTATLR